MPAQPAQLEQESPYNPPGPQPLVFEKFNGINTSTTRPGVPDEQMAWCSCWFPLGPRMLRTLFGIGPALWSAPIQIQWMNASNVTVTWIGNTIVEWFGTGATTLSFFDFANIATLPVMIAITATGAIWQVITTTGVASLIAPDGTILNPQRSNVGISQWGSQYVIIVANQPNGYFVWDGVLMFQAGSLAPGVTLTNVGEGYVTAPSVNATGGSGHGATFAATIAGGIVTGVKITNPGTGYIATDTVTLTFTGGTQAGSGAVLAASLVFHAGGSGATFAVIMARYPSGAGFYVLNVIITNGGSGYGPNTIPVLTGGNPVNPAAAATFLVGVANGVVTSAAVQYPGVYTTPTAPSAGVIDFGYYTIPTGGVTISNPGSGYGPSATVAVTGGGSPAQQAVLSIGIVGRAINSVTVISGGIYGANSAPTVAVTDTATDAAGTVTLMPFAVQGSTVETYSGHVWIANVATITFSAPGSISDFSTANGGGNLTSVDSFLRVGYTQLKQANGFLYLIADSSVNYISGVQTSGNPPTTTFTNQNADPEVGTPYPATVDVFSRNIVFANAFGAHVSYGAAVTKISEPLDGVYNTVANFGGFQLSACKAILFGRKIWAMLVPIIDPISNLQTNTLFIWDSKKWVSAVQDINLTYVQHQEIASVITAWGTDGTTVYPLFQQPSGAITKTVQSRLWDMPFGYEHTKTANRLWALAQFNSGINPHYTVSIDNENGISPTAVYTGTANEATWTNAAGAIVIWINQSSQAVAWFLGSIAVLPPQAVGQQGVLLGMTISTQCADMILISAKWAPEDAQYRG